MMITITDKKDCCGCSACASVCPQKCISMQPDAEGFLYPIIETTSCINCGLCERTCPMIRKKTYDNNNNNNHFRLEDKKIFTHKIIISCIDKPESYVAFIKDTSIRMDSTSGGFFSAISKYIISLGGLVIGAGFNDAFEVEHDMSDNYDGICAFRGAKYVQSRQNKIYAQIKEMTIKDKWILYTGTPCQVAGLKAYLNKEYDKLIAIDLFCHGVGSPLYWQEYLRYVQTQRKSRIQKIKFREKTYGYNSACLAIYFEDGTSKKGSHDDDFYWSAFSKCMIFRPSCYKCPFKTIRHYYSDFSIGDYWNSDGLDDMYREADGCSLILAQSGKGKDILKIISEDITFCEVDLENALLVNGGWQPSKLITSSIMPIERNTIFKDLCEMGFKKTAEKYTPISLRTRIKENIKPLLFKMGILGMAKKMQRF